MANIHLTFSPLCLPSPLLNSTPNQQHFINNIPGALGFVCEMNLMWTSLSLCALENNVSNRMSVCECACVHSAIDLLWMHSRCWNLNKQIVDFNCIDIVRMEMHKNKARINNNNNKIGVERADREMIRLE